MRLLKFAFHLPEQLALLVSECAQKQMMLESEKATMHQYEVVAAYVAAHHPVLNEMVVQMMKMCAHQNDKKVVL